MADSITFVQDDPRLGSLAGDGSIERWPDVDADGRTYDRANWTLQRLSGNRFVVIAPWRVPVVTPMLASEMAQPDASAGRPRISRPSAPVEPDKGS